ncbi:MAG: aminopeptidase P family protein [Candidatus Rokubacteria bacterium]|nr:aminopeptidase P family protein [Candidatus Rokubacteria bacterium]
MTKQQNRPNDDPSLAFEWPVLPDYEGRVPFGTQSVDWEERINMDRMRKYRMGRVREQMQQRNIGAILSINEWNMRYMTSTWNAYWTTPASGLRYSLFPVTRESPILYEQGEIGYHARQMAPWLHKVKVAITGAGWIGRVMGPAGHEIQLKKFCQQILDDMKEAGVASETLAMDVWDPGIVAEFQRLGVRVSPDGAAAMLEARRIKNRDEIECQRTAATISDAEFGAVAKAIRPGVKESELCGIAHQTAYNLGARVYSGIFVTSGPFGWPNPRDESDRIIRAGDILYMDTYNTSYLGYKTCVYRTYSCGKASQEAKDDYALALEWLYNSINVIKAGVTTREIAEQWPSGPVVWKDIHIVSEDQTAGSNWAHGIGLTLYEPPIVWREVSLNPPDIPLEENMTFAIETQHGRPGKHGVRIEEMIRVTKTGVEIMSKFPVNEILEVPLV